MSAGDIDDLSDMFGHATVRTSMMAPEGTADREKEVFQVLSDIQGVLPDSVQLPEWQYTWIPANSAQFSEAEWNALAEILKRVHRRGCVHNANLRDFSSVFLVRADRQQVAIRNWSKTICNANEEEKDMEWLGFQLIRHKNNPQSFGPNDPVPNRFHGIPSRLRGGAWSLFGF